MLDKINSQYKSAQTLSKTKFYQHLSSENAQIYGELYPLSLDYFHELNPAFLFKIAKFEYLSQYSAVTVRDGAASFGAFILKNFQSIPSIKTQFIIDPALAPLVPQNLRQHFSCWSICQAKQIEILQAKRILILGFVNDQVLPSLEKISEQLQLLNLINPDCEVDLFLPIKRNPFGLTWKESYLGYEIVELIKSMLPNTKLRFLANKDLLERTTWQDTYCLDLMTNKLMISDSYISHYLAARGATVSAFNANEAKDYVFEIDLNFNHKIQFSPLPETESLFPEMIFYKKKTSTRDYASDPLFHSLLRNYNF